LLALLPRPLVQHLGVLLGWVWYYAVPLRRSVVLANLRLALPELDAADRRRVARGVLAHVATTVLELLWTGPRRHQALVDSVEVEGLEHYHRLRAQGRGIIAVTAHLGNWDLLACSQALSGVPLSILSKNLSARLLSQFWMKRRQLTGLTILPAQGSLPAVLRLLRRGEVLGVVVDQRTASNQGGRLVEFLGEPAWTTVTPHVLAARTDAALLPVWAIRTPTGGQRVTVGPEIPRGPTAEDTMAAINDQLGRWVRRYPEQWLWLHRRWRL
jgi:KDO2-lipid IV(A) lauroyltransferase